MALRVPAIQFDAVSYTQPSGARIFDELTLGVDAGEVLALVGRSGAGKTTLLRLVNRLAMPQSGRVMVGERDTREWDPIRLRRSIGYVIQDVGLFPHMTVADNIGIVPRLENWEPSRIQARTRELLELVGLSWDTHAGRWPDELSGGQRQRVGVARALAADPAVLLMDEPFGALDPVTRAELQREFRGIQKRLNKTVIIVTHDMLEALSLAHRVAVLDEGTVIACDVPERIVQAADPRIRRLLDAVTLKVRPDA
ncbi:MAG TPA: ATP-binding cassette domain-containing protein [Vicinamibacterales bacterium]|nr:ATP-binding cassette domain-containing protein [Vicinamibacterales bacterium]